MIMSVLVSTARTSEAKQESSKAEKETTTNPDQEALMDKIDNQKKEQETKKNKFIKEYFGEGENAIEGPLPLKTIREILLRFFCGELDEVEETIRKGESGQKIDDLEQEAYTAYVIVDEYIKEHEETLKQLKRDGFEKILNGDTMLNYSMASGDKVMRRVVEIELDRMGVTDPHQRLIHKHRYFGDELPEEVIAEQKARAEAKARALAEAKARAQAQKAQKEENSEGGEL